MNEPNRTRTAAQRDVAEEVRREADALGLTHARLADGLDCSLAHVAHLLERANATTLTLADVALLHASSDVACRELAAKTLHSLASKMGYAVEALDAASAEPVVAAAEVAAHAGSFVRDVALASPGGLDERELRDLRSSMRTIAEAVRRAEASLAPRRALRSVAGGRP